jgi:hypothetical protein
MSSDPLISQKEEAAADVGAQARFADLFDVRRVIGGLLGVYGLILLVLGLFASDEDIEQAAGTNVNLWAGIGLLLVGAVFFAWALARPVGSELVAGHDEPGGPGGPKAPAEAPAPRGVDAAALPGAVSAAERSAARQRAREQRGR